MSENKELITLEKKIEICNAINTAIAKGFTVKTPRRTIYGANVYDGKLRFITRLLDTPGECNFCVSSTLPRIVAVKSVDVEVEAIYEPPAPVACATAVENPAVRDLPEQPTIQAIQKDIATIAQAFARRTEPLTDEERREQYGDYPFSGT